MDISIVIVNYNGKKFLETALDSIKKSFKSNPISHEIIIVDNNSTDESVSYVRKKYPKTTVIKNIKNMGYVGINSCIPKCRGKYMLFLNNDIKIDKDCIRAMLKIIKEDKSVGMVAPRLVNFYDSSLMSGGTWCSRAFYCGHKMDDSGSEIPYMGVGLIRMDIIRKFGYLFDPDYFIYAEDLDLGLRLRLLGYKTIFAKNAILHHVHAATTKKMGSFTTYLLERNLLTTFIKIPQMPNVIILLPYVIALRLVAFLKDFLTLRFSNAYARLKAISWVLMNIGTISAKRAKLQAMREKDDKFLFAVFTEKYLLKKTAIF